MGAAHVHTRWCCVLLLPVCGVLPAASTTVHQGNLERLNTCLVSPVLGVDHLCLLLTCHEWWCCPCCWLVFMQQPMAPAQQTVTNHHGPLLAVATPSVTHPIVQVTSLQPSSPPAWLLALAA